MGCKHESQFGPRENMWLGFNLAALSHVPIPHWFVILGIEGITAVKTIPTTELGIFMGRNLLKPREFSYRAQYSGLNPAYQFENLIQS